jgi:twitching motility protein PilT
LPPILEELCKFDQGMILLAGVTGSGKSTTIASMLDWINHNRRAHILTLEDPIEFTFADDKCLINQREIGQDVKDFIIGMKHAVREDPDVMLVGEMRDRETFETAIQAAETGHLVFGTIHASTAPSTIGRILDLFPQGMHSAIRSALVFNMKAIVAQKLLPTIVPGIQRVPTCEVMTFTPTIRKLILEAQDEKLADGIRIGYNEGMQDFTLSLKNLVLNRMVDRATAFEVAPNPEALKMALKGIEIKEPGIL